MGNHLDCPNCTFSRYIFFKSTLPTDKENNATGSKLIKQKFQILPLENNMKTPEDFGGWTGVLNTGMVIVASLYTAIGFFGYLKYGDYVRGSITLNLPSNL